MAEAWIESARDCEDCGEGLAKRWRHFRALADRADRARAWSRYAARRVTEQFRCLSPRGKGPDTDESRRVQPSLSVRPALRQAGADLCQGRASSRHWEHQAQGDCGGGQDRRDTYYITLLSLVFRSLLKTGGKKS